MKTNSEFSEYSEYSDYSDYSEYSETTHPPKYDTDKEHNP